ncbi:MAG: heat-inducible transcriptional repressor HrcA [Gammaproteobacteria bacterium]|nr:heat-inducible transcriptional repressor HrcA [Gammaproteobacteria bacterium]MDJ0872920.1 heat-inducible transcriptional repressor HrcA [Gammaproteobacteria bacterium]MDJ0892389.1 heat-inducible transcriptional repressor HrcA [Gammaproteobacteria bacterium]
MQSGAQESQLDERSQHLLRALVQKYIRDGQPVGSRTLSRDSGLDLSPATIRNVMADLEEMGLVRSPHTSAGRIPTPLGFRFFVDTLVTMQPPESNEVQRLREQLDPDRELTDLVATTSSLLSEVTRLAGVVTLPKREQLKLRQVEFLPLSGQRVLAILVVNDREVQNRIIHGRRDYQRAELEKAANYLNANFIGRDLQEARQQLLADMRTARQSMNEMMLAAIEMADKAFASEGESDDFVVAGQTNLMGLAELADMEKLRQLFEAFSQKEHILHLLDGALHADGIQIFIGEESGYQVLDECSVVTAPYEVDGRVLGVLGVIGPTRMAYDRVIPIVDVTARLLGSVLNRRQ